MKQFQSGWFGLPVLRSFGVIAGLVFAGCAAALAQAPTVSLREWQLVDTARGVTVSFDEVQSRLLNADVIYLGEEHYTPSHLEAAIRVLDVLLANKKKPAIAMEMFSWDGQAGIDRYLGGQVSDVDTFLHDARWKDNWGGDYPEYAPLVNYAKTHGLRLYGLNPPRALVRKVASQGLATIHEDPDVRKWGFEHEISTHDPNYHRVLFSQLEKCHPGLPEKAYQRIYEASIFRDEGMAMTIVRALQLETNNGGPVVSYTGGGHIQYHVPVPSRVKRDAGPNLRQVSLYLMALDPSHPEEIQEAIHERIADYVWITPLGPRGRQPRCGS